MLEIIAAVGLALTALSTGYLALSLALSRWRRPVRRLGTEPTHFVFVVPALNEEAVIANTIDSLLAVHGRQTLVIVVDDGSTDGTADVVREYDKGRVVLLQRFAPHARTGKGDVLNFAYRYMRERARRFGLPPDDVIIGIVDADGRLAPDALDVVAPYFADPSVGAVQTQVRIRNRQTLIGRCQDYEFLLFSSITQSAREHVGSVGLGGNGQFTRLAALEELGDSPWSKCLTEDLDLGIRLAMNGWHNRFTRDTAVDQQGVQSLSELVRQRTRWMHGHFQCWRLIPSIVLSELPTITVLDLCYYLTAPSLALLGLIAFPIPLALVAYAIAANAGYYFGTLSGLSYLLFLYAASFGPVIALVFLYRRRSGDLGPLGCVAFAHVLAAYSWVWYVAEIRAIARISSGRSSWTKTSRAAEPRTVVARRAAPKAGLPKLRLRRRPVEPLAGAGAPPRAPVTLRRRDTARPLVARTR
jgi:1,2-diacylglycerol 3-beta-glucosyltransferase